MTGHLLLVISLLFISGGESGNVSPRRRSPQGSGGGGGSGGGTQVDFDCPEEFGYYAHPSDCTQYYVCVFGGALLESCTGGLMYSHELQTCDWPRNVGCAPGTTASQQVQQIQPETRQRQSSIQQQQQQPPQRERIIQQQIPKHDLYTEDEQLGVEELDADRQQRVYRGQPQAIGQVQSDRDALSTHSNAIPIPGRDKLSVVSYGTQQQYTRASVTPAQQQYVQQQTTQQQQTTPPRAYNQSRYQSQYEPQFYSLYDEDVDLYKEIGDYSQYNGQSNNNQYRNQKKPQIEIVQQEPARGSTYSKNKYNSQSDIYQSVTPQEYESYSIQTNDDLGYQTQQQTKNTIRSEVKETDGRYRSLVSTASPHSESKATSQRTDQQQQQQTDSTTPKLVTTPLPEGPKNPHKTNDSPAVAKVGTVVNTPSPFKLPDTQDEPPVNLLARGHFIVREPELVTQLVVDITPKPARNRAEAPVQHRAISIRVPQAAIDSNKFSAQDEPKPRPSPIRASDSAEWNGFRINNNAEVRSNHQDENHEINRRPSQRVADSIKIREEYLKQREEAGRATEGQFGPSRIRVPSRKLPETTGRGSSRYQDSPYEHDQYKDSRSTQPTPPSVEQPRLQVTQSPPFVDEGQKYRTEVEEQQKFILESDRNARIQAQLRALGNRNADDREAASASRRQEELKLKAYEEARARQIEEAEREAREQVRQRQFEEARRKQIEEAERVAKELSERKEREEAQRRAAVLEMRRKQIEEAERKANEEARIKAMEEEARRRAEEEAIRERQILEARRANEEAERKQAIEEAQRRAAVEEARRAAIEEARRKAAIEEAERRQAIEEAQRRAAVDEARKKAAMEEAAREEALKRARAEEEKEANRKALDESRRRHLENQRQLEENLSRRQLPARPIEQDNSAIYNSRPSYEATERYKPTSRGSSGFRIVVDSTEPPRVPYSVTRPPKKYVSRNSTLINELYLNEQSTTLSNDERTNSVTPNSLLQTSPGRTYTENARKTLDTPIPISKSDPDYTDKAVRVRPTSYETQSTPGLTRGNNRHRGSQSYTLSPNDAEPAPQPNRGTPAAPRIRPTLKPSTTVVGKASEYLDIFRYPARRPDNVYPTPQPDKTAAKCRKDVCLLPDCSCGGKDIPGDLPLEETPQIVLLTFDDSVNDLNKGLYEDLFERGRVNPNGCPISATFYVSHEWTDYGQVQNLYATGHEIASHSVSHSFGEQFSQKKWTKEIAGQREILAAYGGVRLEDIRGMRAPFLAVGGNKMFKMLHDSNFTYDSSMPVYENKPPSWPYTMDYKIFHDCMIPPCPTKSYPGVWEVPMVMWQDLNGGRCSMGDACSNPPTAEGVYKMLIKNFERHFTTNRAPFGLFYHAAWFTQPHHKEGFIAFLDTINKMPEVWLVTNWQAIQWVRDPTPINRVNNFAPFNCDYPERPKKCNNPKVCNLWHKSGVRYMRTCQPCPEVYPWTGKSGIRNSRVDNEIINE